MFFFFLFFLIPSVIVFLLHWHGGIWWHWAWLGFFLPDLTDQWPEISNQALYLLYQYHFKDLVGLQGCSRARDQTYCYFNLMLGSIWDMIECDKSVPVQNNTFKVAPQRDIQGGLWHSNRASSVSIYHIFDCESNFKEQWFSLSACVLTKSDAPNTQICPAALVHFISILLM